MTEKHDILKNLSNGYKLQRLIWIKFNVRQKLVSYTLQVGNATYAAYLVCIPVLFAHFGLKKFRQSGLQHYYLILINICKHHWDPLETWKYYQMYAMQLEYYPSFNDISFKVQIEI